MLQGRQFANPRHHADPHTGAAEKRAQEEGRRGRWPRGIARQQTGELLVLMVLLAVSGGRRRQLVLMVQLMMVGMRRCDGAAAEDILDEERRPARGGSVLTWLRLLLLAGGLHLPSISLDSRGSTLRETTT